MSDGKTVEFKTPKQKEAEEMAARVEQCETEVQGVLAKWRMKMTVIQIYRDGQQVALEIKAVPDEGGKG
jgi:hypothetical protein